MIKISLISPYGSITNIGLRTISSVLRQEGFKTQMFFLPMPSSDSPLSTSAYFQMEYPQKLLNQLLELTKDSAIIGLSLMDNYMQPGIQLTRALKREGNLVVWGGALATMNPESALEYADAVCIGDGEDAMLELVKSVSEGGKSKNIPNIWFKGEAYPQLKYIEDISVFPLPDYGPEGHFIYFEDEEQLVAVNTYEDYRKCLEPVRESSGKLSYVYRMETTRGCPHNCTYCGNNILKKVQSPKLRLRSIDQIRGELREVKNNFPFVNTIVIEDDTFIVRNDVRQVAQLFKEFGFFFKCLISPAKFTEEQLDFLIDCGLCVCHIGLQTRAPRIEAMYNRQNLNRGIDKVFEVFRKKPQVPLLVDILVDNPWEHSDELIYTFHYLLDNFPPRAALGINSLVFYQGTKLWEKAKQENILDNKYYLKTWHWHRQNKIHYTTLLFVLLKLRLPRGLIRFLSAKPFILLFENDLFTCNIFPAIVRSSKKLLTLKKPNNSR
jgi:radical SAM superfamily enzyme YgiQ (UPF0313 family)